MPSSATANQRVPEGEEKANGVVNCVGGVVLKEN